jgi:acyl carrier protein
MVPSTFVALDALPLLANGKLDRNALPAPPPAAGDGPTSSAAPRTAIEERLAVIWSRILGIDRVGVEDDFFELGGHSLLAVRLLVEVERELGVEVPLASFLETFTVAGLAAIIEATVGQEGSATRA